MAMPAHDPATPWPECEAGETVQANINDYPPRESFATGSSPWE
jgi:hypothetical protein